MIADLLYANAAARPDGTALVTERPGRLRLIREGRLDPTPVGGVPPVLVAPERGLVYQAGLFEVSPHPDFARNRLLYLTYAHGTATDNRLRLARALAARPPVLVLVDPTSAVDAHTESVVAERLHTSRSGLTTVVVSTSPLLLDQADEVAYVEDGKVVVTGTHRELVSGSPRYAAAVQPC